MKKVIKEQDYSKLNGKVANLYSDPENKQFTGQLKIDSVSPTKGSSDKGNWLGNAILDIDGMIKDPISKNVRRKLTFVCGTLPFPETKNLKPGLYIGPKQIFSINLENELKKFCTVSKGGAAVPKADFVSADVTVDEPMTEGKRVIRLTESELVGLIKKVLKEQSPIRQGTMADIMALQSNILKIELEKGIAKIIPDNPEGCNSTNYGLYGYEQGQKNQCKISGSTLCNGACFQKQIMDGIYGPLTKAAYQKYKNEKPYNDDDRTLEALMDSELYTPEGWGTAATQDWQIPAKMDNIKAFQYWVWKDKEKDAPANQSGYQSILCGGKFCQENQAIDGFWGANTKKAWNEFGDEYLKSYSVATKFDYVYNDYKDVQKKFRGTPFANNQPSQQNRVGPFFR